MKAKDRRKNKSILFRLTVAMLVAAFIQFFLILGAIYISGVVPQLKDNEYEIFSQTVKNRKNYIENEMHNRWSVIDNYLQALETMYPSKNAPLTEEEALSYFHSSADKLIEMLRNSGTTGAFIILNNGSERTANSCLFFTDGDPLHNNLENNCDVQMLKGPLKLTKSLKIPLHIGWNYGLTLEDDFREIFDKPYDMAKYEGDNEHLGYWDIIPSIYIPNTRSITYTKPLIDKNGYVFGVVGVEVSEEYFYKLLPQAELGDGAESGYAIIKEDKEGNLIPVMTRGNRMGKYLPYGEKIDLNIKNEKFNGYSLISDDSSIGACYQQLALYNKNTPFADSKWYLLGTTSEPDMTRNSDIFETTIMAAAIISLISGIIIAVLTGLYTAKPAAALVKRIRECMPGTKLMLGDSGIYEIDELAQSVEQLNDKILNHTLKTDKIIDMVNMDIGSFEHNISSDRVKLSTALSRMFHLKTDDTGSVSLDDFRQKILEIKENKTIGNIYQYEDDPPKWLKMESIQTESSEFGIVVDATKDELTRRAITYERDHDILTGIYNRFAFKKHFDDMLEGENFTYGAFLLGDLDNLKHINDLYGHDLGDLYITRTAKVIMKCLEGKNAIYGRMSGDEFYIFLYGDSIDEIRNRIYDFHLALNNDRIDLPDGSVFRLKMSCGVAWYPMDSKIKEELVRYADFAMYQGKHSVKGGIREFDKSSYNENSYMIIGKEELYTILEQQLCNYAFQPIYDVRNIAIYGYEALMRPQGKSINSPDRLLNLAQAQGLLYKVEYNTFYMVLELCEQYLSMMKDAKIFINSVPNQMLHEEEYKVLEDIYGSLLERVVVEITEGETINNEVLARKKEQVKSWNGKLALDDYGSGYANDLALLQLHPDIIKIDRMLIENAQEDKQKQSIISNTISFAKENGIEVLAEGVETKEQLALLIELGIDYVQGYYICRPQPLPDFDDTQIAQMIRKFKEQIHTLNIE